MKPVHICIVVFNRYDLFAKLLSSLRNSTIVPDKVYIIDRGNDFLSLNTSLVALGDHIPISLPLLRGQNLSAAWNWFLQNTAEERILVSDDIEFYPETISKMIETPGDFVGLTQENSSSFACFLIRDNCIQKVGLFDEQMSPDYLYFEDCDYAYRMKLAGIPLMGIDHMQHHGSASIRKKSIEQLKDHNRRFLLAQENYLQKWGGLPGKEIFNTPQLTDKKQ